MNLATVLSDLDGDRTLWILAVEVAAVLLESEGKSPMRWQIPMLDMADTVLAED